jgi:hypothetical protein
MTRPDFAGAAWRKSACGDGASCVEVAQVGTWVGVRDSQDKANDTILAFKGEAWMAFVAQCLRSEH